MKLHTLYIPIIIFILERRYLHMAEESESKDLEEGIEEEREIADGRGEVICSE